jgi:hypothetical protein
MTMNIIERFSKVITNVTYPEKNSNWNIAGILPNSNEYLKFDVRDMFRLEDGNLGKKIKLNQKVDKIVFETNNKWLILDQKEFNKYLLRTKQKIIKLDDLINSLDWTKIILKE